MISRDHALRIARRGTAITAVALVALAGIYVRAILFTPIERTQGPAQKIFYIHAPAAWSTLLAFGIAGLLSILYLWLKDRRIDAAAAASAEVGLAFGCLMLTTGPIWGKTIWGTWWTWDARLTSALFIELLFVGYVVLRGAIADPRLRANYAAVLAILGLPLILFIHLSVQLFRTLHPQPILLKPSAPSAPPEMLITLLSSFAVYTLLYVGFVTLRYGLGLLREAHAEAMADGVS
ncbi:MAG TPA: cytochrome c biogenesis protein CcsA [Gemmatimonadales bacterium]|jgi:heme exporter protein C